ncbi:MAG TPA: efflux RND transporter periplasmic adaptor subunit [Candidatus Cybelea sp.]|nr:efflux RND transporter periplasmic adaptor subunit [Candidatus Cybelea sp.]
MRLRNWIIGAVVIAVCAGGGYWFYTTRDSGAQAQAVGAQRGPVAQPVVVAPVLREKVPNDVSVIGAVQAYETVAVKSRIDGQIVKIFFKEGDEVQAGDLLIQLDARAIEAQLHQAEATLAKDQAQGVNMKRTAGRLGDLAQREFASRQAVDDAKTNEMMMSAASQADQAAIESAKVQLTYTQIRAPISGRTGVINLTTGNVVKANDTNAIVTINRVHPINVLFAVPQKYFDLVRQTLSKGPVEAFVEFPNSNGRKIVGKIQFFDNTIDQTTGTFQVKAVFGNEDGSLWPGMFVTVTVRLGTDSNALTVPSAAVQTGQQGTYIFVVRQDQTVEMRPIKVGREAGQKSVIESGVNEGEQVVTEGQLRLTNGTKVEVRNAGDAAGSALPPGAEPAKASQ